MGLNFSDFLGKMLVQTWMPHEICTKQHHNDTSLPDLTIS